MATEQFVGDRELSGRIEAIAASHGSIRVAICDRTDIKKIPSRVSRSSSTRVGTEKTRPGTRVSSKSLARTPQTNYGCCLTAHPT